MKQDPRRLGFGEHRRKTLVLFDFLLPRRVITGLETVGKQGWITGADSAIATDGRCGFRFRYKCGGSFRRRAVASTVPAPAAVPNGQPPVRIGSGQSQAEASPVSNPLMKIGSGPAQPAKRAIIHHVACPLRTQLILASDGESEWEQSVHPS